MNEIWSQQRLHTNKKFKTYKTIVKGYLHYRTDFWDKVALNV